MSCCLSVDVFDQPTKEPPNKQTPIHIPPFTPSKPPKKKEEPSSPTKPPPILPINIPALIRSRTRQVRMPRPLKHALPLGVHGPHIPTPDPVRPVIDLERRVRVRVDGGGHPGVQAAEGGREDGVGEVVRGRVLGVDLDGGAAGEEVAGAVREGPATVVAVGVVVDVLGDEVGDALEGGGVVGFRGGGDGAEEDVGFGARGAVEVFVFGLAGGGGVGDGCGCVFGVEEAFREEKG